MGVSLSHEPAQKTSWRYGSRQYDKAFVHKVRTLFVMCESNKSLRNFQGDIDNIVNLGVIAFSCLQLLHLPSDCRK